jgi:hypothetical protein
MAMIGATTSVKLEQTDDSPGLVDVSDGSQPSHSTWVIARLLKVILPHAVVSVKSDGHTREFTVSVDDLRPASKVGASEQRVLHPSLQDIGKVLEEYDYDFCESSFTLLLAEHMLAWAHLATQACTENVLISLLSEESKLPFILQVRAKEAFKNGALMLVPAFGSLLTVNGESQMKLTKCKGTLHEAMLSHVILKVRAGSTDRRRRGEQAEPRTTEFAMHSPLLAGRSQRVRGGCLANVPPFWAMLRCAGPRASHNMDFATVVLRDPGWELKAGHFPKVPKGIEFSVEIPIIQNVCPISKGEVLCLPFLDE